MSLFNDVMNMTNSLETTRNDIKREIIMYFDKYLNSEKFDEYLKSRLDNDAISKRKLVLYVSFWNYHPGCSGTHFQCCNRRWTNPDEDEYSFNSSKYKGIKLIDIQVDVVNGICKLIKDAMYDREFSDVCINREFNRLGYADYKIVVSW